MQRRRHRVQRVSQRRPGGDAELGEDPVQVSRDGARGHVEPGGDLAVGQAGRGQLGDLAFLEREGRAAAVDTLARGPGRPELGGRASRPRTRAEPLEAVASGGELAPGVTSAAEPPQAFAVRELHAGELERPLLDSRQGQRCTEQGRCFVIGRDHRRGRGRDQSEPRRQAAEVRSSRGLGVSAGLVVASGVHRGVDQVQRGPQRLQGMGAERARRGDGRGVGVALLEVAGGERGLGEGVVREVRQASQLARCGPLDHRLADVLTRPAFPPVAGDQGDGVAAGPGIQPVSALLAQSGSLGGEPLRFVPSSGVEFADGEHVQRHYRGADGAALSPVPDHPQESLPAARQPVGVEPGDRGPDDESVVLGVPQLSDLVVQFGQRPVRRRDRVGKCLGEQPHVYRRRRAEPAHRIVERHPVLRAPGVVAHQHQRVQHFRESVAVLVGLAERGFDGGGQQAVSRLRVAFAVEQEIGGGGRRAKRLAEGRIPAMSVVQQLRRAVELSSGVGADVRRVGQPPASVGRVRAEIGRPQQPGDGADDVAALQGAMGAVLDRGGDLLVRRESCLGEVMAAPFRLIRAPLGQAQMRLTPFVVCRTLDHHRLDHRMPEPQLAGPVIDHDEMVAFGWPEVIESSRPARRRQDTQVAGAVEHGQQEQAPRRLGEPLDPGVVQRPHLPAHP